MHKFLLITSLSILLVSLIATPTYAQEATTNEVYEALLESKETLIQYQSEKIDLLNNAITWILAISALFSTIAIAVISYIYRMFLNDLKKRNEQLEQQEEVISKVVEAKEFQEKLDQLQQDLAGLQNKQKNFQRKIGNPDKIRW